jgi:flagellar basal-body rod protein FlgB
MLNVNGSYFKLLERSLQAASLRQAVIANNIANVDTPKFKRSDVRFEDLLQQELNGSVAQISGRRTDPRHMYIGHSGKEVTPEVVTDHTTAMNNNLNNVDIDAEMALLAKNQLRYNTLIQQVNHEIRLAKIALEAR